MCMSTIAPGCWASFITRTVILLTQCLLYDALQNLASWPSSVRLALHHIQ